jgi:hypothetical protein
MIYPFLLVVMFMGQAGMAPLPVASAQTEDECMDMARKLQKENETALKDVSGIVVCMKTLLPKV